MTTDQSVAGEVRPSTAATAVRCGLVALVAYGLLAAVFVIPRGGSADWFVKFGEIGPGNDYTRHLLGPDLSVPYDVGQDGVSFWVAARDPLLTDPAAYAANVDRPSYRAQRMLYPSLVAPFRLGGEQALLWGLLIINLLVVFFGTYFTSLLATELGAPSRAAYAFALSPVMVISFVQDLADGLAVACLVAAVLAVRRERWGWAVLAGGLAVLAKEQSLLALVAVAVVARGAPARRIGVVVVPGLIGAAWALYLRVRLGWPPNQVDVLNPVPFSSYVSSYRYGWSVTGRWGEMAVALAVVAIGVWVVVRFWHRRRSLELAACLPSVLLIPFYSDDVIYRDLNWIRALGPVVTLLALDLYAGWSSGVAEVDNAGLAVT